ncbi:tRNA1Val (adenine37-N6)-methyltransferase [Anseongella ginsenosidimutans]|uniref:tRNA1(Val) (adenine(37)-N6)-methyltransferase n=1 Tax=Anseongella ginsenosidimutans TaxID=496056 RepID=A0A4R3KNL3_9SPHI|nr:methyltransferase [Anseongella ginsenosidimutans]QEC53657.1 methyltransferase [Anseongella ginsenosidimutans]TCS86093.1 tRNA1Val (adenine37-N6)-methyltransferase [Anseongella ginsenosidimutans]
MANSWFRFKQFIIEQDRCAMKVGTDGVLLGALAGTFSGEPGLSVAGGNILDIGTGTGLVALMLAQRSAAQIDAVEIEEAAAGQAAENVARSDWAERIQVIHADFRDFYRSCDKKYDLIASNPPYFRNSLKPVKEEKALARHGSNEFYRELVNGSMRLLQPWGRCCLILPAGAEKDLLLMAGEENLYLQQGLTIRSKPGEKAIRRLLTFGKTKTQPLEKELVIYEREGRYTQDFAALVKPYYLNL